MCFIGFDVDFGVWVVGDVFLEVIDGFCWMFECFGVFFDVVSDVLDFGGFGMLGGGVEVVVECWLVCLDY